MKSVIPRRWVIVGAVIVAAIVALVTALSVVVRTAWFSSQVTAALTRQTGRRVTFSAIRPTLLWGAGARVDDLTLFEEDGTTPCLECRRVSLSVRLLPLLWKKLVLGGVTLDRPRLALVRGENGRWNIESIWKREKPTAPPGAPVRPRKRPSKPSFSISRIRISDGSLTASSPEWSRPINVTALDMTASDIVPGRLPSISGSGRVEGVPLSDCAAGVKEIRGAGIAGGLLSGSVTVRTRGEGETSFRAAGEISGLRARAGGFYSAPDKGLDLALDLEGEYFAAERKVSLAHLSARGSGGALTARGSVTGFGTSPAADIECTVKNLRWEKLGTFHVPRLEIEGEAALEATFRGTAGDLAVDATLDLTGSRLAYRGLLEKDAGLRAAVSLPGRLTASAFQWNGAALTCGGIALMSEGSVGRGDSPRIEARVTGDGIDLSELGGLLEADVGLKGRGDVDIRAARPAGGPFTAAALSGKARVTRGEVRLPALAKPISYDAAVTLSEGIARLGFGTVRLGRSLAEGHVEIDLNGEPTFESDFHCPLIRFDDFAGPAEKSARIFSPGIASAAMAGVNAQPPLPFMKRVKGRGRITIGELVAGRARSRGGRVKFVCERGVLRTEELHLPFYGGAVEGELKAEPGASPARYGAEASLSNVNLEKLLSDLFGYGDALTGRLFADCSAEARGRFSLRRGIEARGSFSVRDGRLRSFGFIREMAPLFLLLGRQAKAKEFIALGELFRKAPAETAISRCEGRFGFKGERWGMGDLLLEIAGRPRPARLKLEGSLNSDGRIELVGRLSFPRGSPYYAQLAPYFPDDGGWITVPFPIPIGGTLENPAIDAEAARQGVLQCAAELGRLRLRKEVEKKIDTMLKPPPPKPGEKPDASDVGREFLGGALKELLKRAVR